MWAFRKSDSRESSLTVSTIAQESFDRMKAEAEAKLAEYHDFEGQKAELVNRERSTKQEAEAATQKVMEINEEIDKLNSQAQMGKREIDAVAKQIRDITEKAKGRNGGALQAVTNDLQHAEARLQALQDQIARVSWPDAVPSMKGN
jgi:predicted  nucleic acid-binding Zn-ribbon protein